jgi:hypothetical protein
MLNGRLVICCRARFAEVVDGLSEALFVAAFLAAVVGHGLI